MLKNQSERVIQRGFGGECRDGDKIQVMHEFQNDLTLSKKNVELQKFYFPMAHALAFLSSSKSIKNGGV